MMLLYVLLLAIASFVILVVMMLYNIAVTLPINNYNISSYTQSYLNPISPSSFPSSFIVQYVGEGADQTIMLVMKHFVNLSPK